jgi:hypothetical protein
MAIIILKKINLKKYSINLFKVWGFYTKITKIQKKNLIIGKVIIS